MLEFNTIDVDIINNNDEDTDPISQYINEIMMILNTEPHEVLGCSDMTIDLERFVFDTNVDGGTIEQLIRSKLQTFTTWYEIFETDVDVNFVHSDGGRDTCVIDFTINAQARFSVVVK